jgi:hypothetical protein
MKNANPGQQRKSDRQLWIDKRRRELTPPLRGSNLIPETSVVCAITFIIARSENSKSSDGMIYLGTNRNTESQKQRVNNT